jgi:hypothetical protein
MSSTERCLSTWTAPCPMAKDSPAGSAHLDMEASPSLFLVQRNLMEMILVGQIIETSLYFLLLATSLCPKPVEN